MSAPREQALPLQGSCKPLAEMRYPLLYEHSQRLGRLIGRDRGDLIAALGIVLIGGGLGAVLAGCALVSQSVCLPFGVGVFLLVVSRSVRQANVESARNLKRDFDRNLSMWERSDADIEALRDHFEVHESQHLP